MNTLEVPAQLIERLREARRVAVLTGAGISAESGIPTFREAQTGLWARYDPEQLATAQAFRRDPKLVWDWYQWRRDLVSRALPNPGHFALARIESLVPLFTLITQNIDGLHARAGSKAIIELHGNIARVKCFDQEHPIADWEALAAQSTNLPPRCPQCGSLLRPDVVWFGENLPGQALHAASVASRKAEVFLTIGTSAVVQPAASLPLLALEEGAVTVEINPVPTPLSSWMDYRLEGAAGTVLPQLVELVWGKPGS